MASYTKNLELLKKDPVEDGADTFNIETMLNENWDKIDEKVATGKAMNDHITNQKNPHKVTAEQVGAASSVHSHTIDQVEGLTTALSNKASKTQPTSYSAPVADGLTGNIFYWKTEDACVTVELGISKKDELTDWEVLGVLPVGFRPRAQRNFSSGDGTKGACIVSIYNDGNVRVQAVSAGLTGVVGCITYLALEE